MTQQPIEFTAVVRVVPKVIRENNKEAKYSVDAEYPQIEGDARFDKFNREARAMIAKDVTAFKTAETSAAGEEEMDLPEETQTSTLNIGYQVRFATDDLISVEFSQSEYSRGAAHPNSFTTVLNYDVKNGKKIALADLFNPKSNYLNVISAYCIKDLKDQSKKEKDSMLMDDQIQEGAAPRADNYKAWTITRKGLWIVFDPYQVAAYAAGPQHVLVPYSALKPIVKSDGPIGSLAG
ncbi:MAG TPA: RsiV family protein [Pyrinomonadaceae bacterium]